MRKAPACSVGSDETRSVMKQLFEDAKWMVLQDKMKKRALFKFPVDV